MLGEAIFQPRVSHFWITYRFVAAVVAAVPVLVAIYRPDVATSAMFVAGAVAVCAQVGVLIAPRVLWLQFERQVHWEDICHDTEAQRCFLVLSNIVVVTGLSICITVLVGRYHAGDVLEMGTVAEIGSTLFLVLQAQATLGKPALAYGQFRARRKAERLAQDLLHRPTFRLPDTPLGHVSPV